MNGEIELKMVKLYRELCREAEDQVRREDNAKDLKRKWKAFLRGQDKNAERR